MNVHVGRIAWRQAIMDGFALEASPLLPLMASDSEAENDDDDDRDASSTNEMST